MQHDLIEDIAKAIDDALPESDKFTLAPSQIRRAARAAHSVIAARVAELWQPIETFSEPTAPSSGSGVLVAGADGTVGEAYFRNYGDKDDDGWWWANTNWGDYPQPDRPRNPTHWQPLPTPPALAPHPKGTGQ